MSLELLTLGRSWSAKKDSSLSPYRSRYGLPKFNTDKSPSVEKTDVRQSEMKRESLQMEKRSFGLASLGGMMVAFQKKVSPKLFLKWNFFGKRQANVVAKKMTRLTTVQAELCLDRVTVLRNDLTDADLEVVPMRSAVSSRNNLTRKMDNLSSRIGDLFKTEETLTH